jgi:membrane fusion protein, multidrug efflux system
MTTTFRTAPGLVLPAVLAILAITLAGCQKPPAGGAGPAPARESGAAKSNAPNAPNAPGGKAPGGRRALQFPVEVAKVEVRDVEYTINAVGGVEAFETVQVTARVAGVVDRVRLSEGQAVTTGTVLIEVEPQRYKLAVDSAEATLEKTRAAEADARAGVDRREKAVATTPGLIPDEEIASWKTRLRTAQADTGEKKAALAQAELNLRDAYVRAPVAGIIETRRVQTGQYVQPGTVLATLIRRDPLLLRFSVPAPEATSIRSGMMARFVLREDAEPHEARITHVAQAADPSSRMVTITAEIKSPNRPTLRPGAFAEVSIPVGSARATPVLPQTAVRPTERGFVAFVIEGKVARERLLTLGLRTADGAVEAKSGIKAGELLVVRGAEALSDGALVEVEKPRAKPADKTAERKAAAPDGSGTL